MRKKAMVEDCPMLRAGYFGDSGLAIAGKVDTQSIAHQENHCDQYPMLRTHVVTFPNKIFETVVATKAV